MKIFKIVLVALVALSSVAFARVNVNTANQAELETLKDIGPVKAKAIIAHRKQNGGFKSLEDLEKVDGIGPKIIAIIKNDVSFIGATTNNSAQPKPSPADPKALGKEGVKPPAVPVKPTDKTVKPAVKSDAQAAKAGKIDPKAGSNSSIVKKPKSEAPSKAPVR